MDGVKLSHLPKHTQNIQNVHKRQFFKKTIKHRWMLEGYLCH